MKRCLALLLTAFLLGQALADDSSATHVCLKTSHGDITIALNSEKAPLTVENFLRYVRDGHYDGTVFHRVMDGFMIQGGGFELSNGALVQKPTRESIKNESSNGLSNLRGTIAMARTNDPDSATAQFFINVVDNPTLNLNPVSGGYTVFGKVVQGMDVVDRIKRVPVGVKQLAMLHPRTGEMIKMPAPNVPSQAVIIQSATIHNGASPASEPSAAPDMCPLMCLATGGVATQFWLCPLIAFLLGSIPFGLLIARSRGVDIRQHGSGNIGATNVWRTLGKKAGIPCLLLDILKGFIPVILAINLIQIENRTVQIPLGLPESWILTVDVTNAISAQIIHILAALLAVLGHNYSPWVGFKGGKGIATSAGVILGLMPVGVLILFAVWLLLFLTTRYVSIASIGAACSLPILTLYGSWHHGRLQDGSWNKPLFVFALVIAILAVWKHRTNIKRLIEGTEHRFSRKSKADKA